MTQSARIKFLNFSKQINWKLLTEKSTVWLDWGCTVTDWEAEKPLSFCITSETEVGTIASENTPTEKVASDWIDEGPTIV